jgi:hypothetical protein
MSPDGLLKIMTVYSVHACATAVFAQAIIKSQQANLSNAISLFHHFVCEICSASWKV